MKTKKIPYYLLIGSLTIGASIILGFLSFTGAIALWPIVPVASVFFALSVAYEGEIYLQNLKGALNKLGFKDNFMHRTLARRYLAKYAPAEPNPDDPIFFQDYMKMLALRDKYRSTGILNTKDRQRKKALKKSINKMEKWFTQLLFEQKVPQNKVEEDLVTWLKAHHKSEWLEKANKNQYYYKLAAIFSGISGISMAFGTTYLLLGSFASIPIILTATPLLLTIGISVASLVAGSAYALLTFNTITDIIDNDTVQNWIHNLKQNLIEKPTIRSVMLGSVSLVLFTLAIALTICTAGTWWTVIKQTQPLFKWMAKLPKALLMVFPIINGAAALSFNFQNTSESFEMVNDILDNPPSMSLKDKLTAVWNDLMTNETFWQRLNPFRFLLKISYTPLRILFFLGHLVSIALTSDRLPGVPQIVSFLVGLICEGFEDTHYFFDIGDQDQTDHTNASILKNHLNNDDGHDHESDLPSRMLRFLFTPVFYLAALWDYNFSDSPNWQKSSHKFTLTDDSVVDDTAEDIKVDTSQTLSKLGMSALESHIKASLLNKKTNTTTMTDGQNDNRQELGQEVLMSHKLRFFGHLEPIIDKDKTSSPVNFQHH